MRCALSVLPVIAVAVVFLLLVPGSVLGNAEQGDKRTPLPSPQRTDVVLAPPLLRSLSPSPGAGHRSGAPSSAPPSEAPFVAYTLSLQNNSVVPGNFATPNGWNPVSATVDTAKGEVYVSNYASATVSVINTSTDTLVDSITLPYCPLGNGASPHGIAYDPALGEIWVANYYNDSISVINDTNNSVVNSFYVGSLVGGNGSIGRGPVGLVYDPAQRDFYLTLFWSDVVDVISDTTESVVRTIPVGTEPYSAVYDSAKGEIFVGNLASGNLSVINDRTNTVVATIPMSYPVAETYDPAQDEIFVTNGTDEVSVVQDATNEVTTSLQIGENPWGIAYDAAKDEVFAVASSANNFSVISTRTNTVLTAVGGLSIPAGAVYDARTSQIFICNFNASTISVVNDTTNAIDRTIELGAYPEEIAYDAGKGELFVSAQYTRFITVVNDTSNLIVASVPAGVDPGGLAYDAAKGQVWVANTGSNNVTIISDATDKAVGSVPVGLEPYGVAYDPGKGEIFVTNQGSDNVSVISDSTDLVVANIPVGPLPWGVVYDSGKGELFVMNDQSNNVSVISDSTNHVAATIHVGVAPEEGAYDPGLGALAVANLGSDNVSFLSDATDKVVGSTEVGASPYGVAYDSTLGEFYISNSQATTDCCNLSVISASTDQVLDWLPVGTEPLGLTYDTGNGYLYVVNNAMGSISVVDDGAPRPGPSISSFTAVPSSVPLNLTTLFDVVASGGVGPLSYTYTGLPPNCASENVSALNCTPDQEGSFKVTVWVNDSADHSVNALAALSVGPPIPPLEVVSFMARPATVEVGATSFLNVSAAGGTGNYSYAYAGLPAGCLSQNTSALVCAPAVAGAFAVTVFVNDSAGQMANATTSLSSIAPVPVLRSVTIDPSSALLAAGSTAAFAPEPVCSAGPCPDSVGYSWSLNNSLATANFLIGPATTVTSGNLAGAVTLSVIATLGQGAPVTGSSVITIYYPQESLVSLTASTASPYVAAGTSDLLTASPTCHPDAGCPFVSLTYVWSLSDPKIGALGSQNGNTIYFQAAPAKGPETVSVRATLGNVTRWANVTFMVTHPPPAPGPSWYPWDLYAVVLAAVAVGIVLFLYLTGGRRAPPNPPKYPASETPVASKKEAEEPPADEKSDPPAGESLSEPDH